MCFIHSKLLDMILEGKTAMANYFILYTDYYYK